VDKIMTLILKTYQRKIISLTGILFNLILMIYIWEKVSLYGYLTLMDIFLLSVFIIIQFPLISFVDEQKKKEKVSRNFEIQEQNNLELY